MTVLRIYKLDCEGDAAVSKLQEGEHIIGRGSILKCDDRRVSRNHGVIKISQDVATLMSTHVNPCYYQSASSPTIIILKKDNPINLSNGDKFALLADKFWYKIEIGEFHSETPNFNNNVIDPEISLNVTKRRFDEDQSPGCSKKLRTETDTSTRTEDTIDYQNKSQNDNGNQSDLQNGDESKSEIEDVASVNIKEEVDSIELEAENDLESILGDLKQSASNEEQTNPCNGQKILHTDNLSQSKNKTPRTEKENKQTPSTYDNKLRDMLFSSDEENELEVQNDSGHPNQNITTNPQTNTPNKNDNLQQEVKVEHKNDDADTAGPSDTNKKVVWRNRCWYGMNCYRKNKHHYAEYSHPGDSDYASDPDDERPMCGFGADCYRRNPDHRKDYRHPRKMNKKPTKSKPPVNVNIWVCSHCNCYTRKPGYESDPEDPEFNA